MKYFFLIMLMGVIISPSAKIENLSTAEFVDIELYLGKWYELARFEQKFQKGCTASTAQYDLREDGDIKVLNSCRMEIPSGKLKESEARAWVVDDTNNAKLKVQFFLTGLRLPFFAGNYWILDLGDESSGPYTHSIVGDDSGDYLWILARSPNVAPEYYDKLVKKAKDLGFDTSKLLKTKH